jgi:hypothetical protein
VDMLCGTMGDNCPEVAPFNGEDYFEAGKPIGCCYTPQQQAVWAKWNSLATRVAKCASPPAPTTPAQPSRPEAYAQSSVRGAPTHESTLRPAQGSTPQAPLTARPPRARARQARRHPRVPARDEGHDRSQVGVPPPPPSPVCPRTHGRPRTASIPRARSIFALDPPGSDLAARWQVEGQTEWLQGLDAAWARRGRAARGAARAGVRGPAPAVSFRVQGRGWGWLQRRGPAAPDGRARSPGRCSRASGSGEPCAPAPARPCCGARGGAAAGRRALTL